MAVDYGAYGIRANAVALGSVDTGRADASRPEIAALHALGRVGRAGEVADVVAWLLSPRLVRQWNGPPRRRRSLGLRPRGAD